METNTKGPENNKVETGQRKEIVNELEKLTEKIEQRKEEKELEGRKQKVSVSYTVRAFGENIKKLHDLQYMTAEDYAAISLIKQRVAEKYMREELGI